MRVQRTKEQLIEDTKGDPIAMAVATIADEVYVYLPKILGVLENIAAALEQMNIEK